MKEESRPDRSDVHVALLRGINLGRRRLPMRDLAAMFEAAGCTAVRTYIQSGNVVYAARPAVARVVAAAIERAIASRHGFEVPVVTRTARDLEAVVRGNPFAGPAADPKTLHVGFLLDLPVPARVKALDPDRSPPDRFLVRGREVYFLLPNGMANTRLTSAYFDATLGTTMTVRNWNTVRTLLEMTTGG